MSEARPTYIPCASDNNAQTDVLVTRHGDLVRLVGYAEIDLIPADAIRLAAAIGAMARVCGHDGAENDHG